MNGQDLDGTAPQVIITSYENAAAQVRLDDRVLGEYETIFTVALHAGGFDARVSEVSVTPWDGGGLPAFLDGLASDFRGWAGSRSWAVPHLTVTAAFRSGGHVELCWTVRPGAARSGWEGSLTTWVEAGQQMAELAAAVNDFLTPAPPVQLRRRRVAGGTVSAPSGPAGRRPSQTAPARGGPTSPAAAMAWCCCCHFARNRRASCWRHEALPSRGPASCEVLVTRWPARTAEVASELSAALGTRTAWGEPPCLYTIRAAGGRCLLDPTAVPSSWWEGGPLPEVLARITQVAADMVAVPGIQRRADSYGIAIRFEGHCVPRHPVERARFGEAEAAAAALAPGRGLAAARYLIGVDRAGVTYLSRQQQGWMAIRSTVIAVPGPAQDGPVTAAVRRLTEVVSGIAVPAGERSAEPGR